MKDAAREKFNRLVDALDDLVLQEAASLAHGDYDALQAIQERADPVVAGLSDLGSDVADERARARVAGLLARRQHSMEFLESQLAVARAELAALQESATRVAQIAPAYGRAERTPPTSSRFQGRG
ncbi:MAG TPA: hypothetical protein VNR00_14715 [Opitutus sp.]|nr:hypothetical protein [Opitutus sp.]